MISLLEENLAAITLLLAIGTFWMAISTRAAARASKQIFELESRPYLVFSKPMFRIHQQVAGATEKESVKTKALTLGIEFKNAGRVPLRYSTKSICQTFDGRTVENPTFRTRGGIIYPNDFGVFWFGTLSYEGQLIAPKSGVIEYTVEYEAIDQQRRFLKTENMRYVVTSFEPYNFDWHYLEDSEESAL